MVQMWWKQQQAPPLLLQLRSWTGLPWRTYAPVWLIGLILTITAFTETWRRSWPNGEQCVPTPLPSLVTCLPYPHWAPLLYFTCASLSILLVFVTQ